MRTIPQWLLALTLLISGFFALAQPPNVSGIDSEVWTGTFEQMLQRGVIRIAVPYDRTIYIDDKGAPKGIAINMSRAMQTWIAKQYAAELKGKTLSVKLVPTQSADLLTTLTAGKADMVIGDLGLYKPSVNSHEYLLNHAYKLDREVLVSGPSAVPITSFEDLAGQTVYGGHNTNFPETLQEINKSLRSKGKAPVNIISPVGALDGEDLLEMVDAGLIPYVIIGDWKAKLWQPIYKRIVIHDDIFTLDAGWIGYGVRSSNQDLNQVIYKFIGSNEYDQAHEAYRGEDYKAHVQGLKDPIEKSAWARFESMWPLFQKYGAQYNLDPLFIAALGFQETLLNQSAVSKVGAIGVMQLMPATGNSLGVGDIHLLEPNIHAGAEYMNQLITRYFPDAQFKGDNRALFAVASYNIGPNNVAKARDQAKAMGFDPNQWFGNVEFVATQRMGYEPMIYVRNVYKYFISYELKRKKIESIQP